MVISTDAEKNTWQNPMPIHYKISQKTNRRGLPQLDKEHQPKNPIANMLNAEKHGAFLQRSTIR